MKEKPIILHAHEVRALLEHSHVQIRRVIKPQPVVVVDDKGKRSIYDWRGGAYALDFYPSRSTILNHSPHGQPGQRLWVKETWQYADWTEDGFPWIRYSADLAESLIENVPGHWSDCLYDVWAVLSEEKNYLIKNKACDQKWRSPVAMPRWASRLDVENVGVRVERLQDISEADFAAGRKTPWVWVTDLKKVDKTPVFTDEQIQKAKSGREFKFLTLEEIQKARAEAADLSNELRAMDSKEPFTPRER